MQLRAAVRMQVRGLCLGMMAGTATYATAFAGVWLCTDWGLEASKAAERAGVSEPLVAPDNEASDSENNAAEPQASYVSSLDKALSSADKD